MSVDVRPQRSASRARQRLASEISTRRLAQLGPLCRQLELGLFNRENDPGPLFSGLTYRDVMAVALRDPVVARVLRSLPMDWRWPDE